MDIVISERASASERNGEIVVRRTARYGRAVYAHGFQQSGPRLSKLWRRTLLGVPDDHPVKRVLMLGLGGGIAIDAIRKRFPRAHLTVIEWDPAMVEVARTSGMFKRKNAPEIILADAYEAVPKLDRTFDVILVDLFTGGDPEPRLEEDAMVEAVGRALEPDGFLFLNVFKSVRIIPAFERRLSRYGVFRLKDDLVAGFRHVGQGRAGDPVPEGFVHPMQSPSYLLGGWEPDATNVELVGEPGSLGTRWHYGPLWFENHTTDIPPAIDRGAPSRMVIWQPMTKLGKPAGWHRSWIQMNPQQHGFADLRDNAEYWKGWTEHARRHRSKWLKDARYEIVEVPLETFAAAYHKSGKLPSLRKDFVRLLERRIKHHGSLVHLFVARDKASGEIISGLAVVDVPDVSVSMHTVAFLHPRYEKTSVGTGLIDHWFRHCLASGIRFPHFGLVWSPGDPSSWKGYSKFKRQFNLHLLLYPMPLIRFVRQKKS